MVSIASGQTHPIFCVLAWRQKKKKKSHGKGAVILSHNTLSCRSNLTCLRAILPSENLLHANAAKEHT